MGGTGAAFSGHLTAGYGWQVRIHKHRLLTFVLDGKTPLPPQLPPAVAVPIDDPSFVVDPQRAKAGAAVYFGSMCLGCRGFFMIGGGYAPDLRASPVPLAADAFREVVQKGAFVERHAEVR